MNINSRTILGAAALLLGIFLLLNRGQVLGPGQIIGHFWPSMFIIPVGLFFHWLYFFMLQRRGSGLLIPGGTLLTVGIVCQIAMLFDNWGTMWPGFILAPAVGLFEFYWFGTRNKWLLIPINILFVLSMLFFVVFSIGSMLSTITAGQPFIAILLIIIGGYVLVARKRRV